MLPIVEHQVQDEQPQTTQQHLLTASASAPSPLPPPPASSVAASHGGRRKQAKPQKKNGRSSMISKFLKYSNHHNFESLGGTLGFLSSTMALASPPSCPLSFVLQKRDIHLQSRKILQIFKIFHTLK